ncbi:MAG: hypothetical protein U0Q22_06025 [Acidimicrobiales bacterium]
MGETSMTASPMSAGMPQPQVGASHRRSSPMVPAGEVAMAAICAFAVLLRLDRVTRTGPGSVATWIPIPMLRSTVAVGPEPPVPRLV